MTQRAFLMIFIFTAVLLTAGCAAGPNHLANTPDAAGNVAGFWTGLWQGVMVPFTFLVSLFSDKVHIYEIHNNGRWYDFGFLIGVAVLFGTAGSASD